MIADLVNNDQEYVLCRGGRGGRGNARFANSRDQAPRLAERGEPGHEFVIKLELKLIADVGIIGVPNAGKSTLLAAVRNAKPKIADYPFTTIEPNLGVARLDGENTLVLADIPTKCMVKFYGTPDFRSYWPKSICFADFDTEGPIAQKTRNEVDQNAGPPAICLEGMP